jgi:O-antigen/teichoic acid export membrane protein
VTNPLNPAIRNVLSRKWSAQAWYIPLLALAMGLMMLRPLLMARMFTPADFATYSVGLLISSTFCMLGCLGLQPMLQRQMPMNLIAGKELASLVLLIQGMLVAVLCAVVAIGLGFSGASIAGLSSESIAISVLHGLSQQLFVLATVESRSRGEPLRFSWQYLARAVLVVVGASAAAWQIRSPNATLLVEALLSLLVSWRITEKVLGGAPIRFRALLNLVVRRIPKIRWMDSLALMAVMLVGFALTNLDRWLAASWLPTHQFAWYAFAWILLAASQSVQSMINSSVYPSLARRYAAHGRSSSFRLAAGASVLLISASAILAWPVNYVLSVLISTWFTEYRSSLPLIPVFMAVAVVRLSDFWSSHLIIIGQERLLLFINISVGACVSIIWFGSGQFEADESEFFMRLAWLALTLTIFNYFFVLCAAVRFRR